MHSVTRTIFPVFVFRVMHRVILLTRFCKLLTTVAILSGGGHVPQVPQWHDASGTEVSQRDPGGAPVGDLGDEVVPQKLKHIFVFCSKF